MMRAGRSWLDDAPGQRAARIASPARGLLPGGALVGGGVHLAHQVAEARAPAALAAVREGRCLVVVLYHKGRQGDGRILAVGYLYFWRAVNQVRHARRFALTVALCWLCWIGA